jgi:hypothetical protein
MLDGRVLGKPVDAGTPVSGRTVVTGAGAAQFPVVVESRRTHRPFESANRISFNDPPTDRLPPTTNRRPSGGLITVTNVGSASTDAPRAAPAAGDVAGVLSVATCVDESSCSWDTVARSAMATRTPPTPSHSEGA